MLGKSEIKSESIATACPADVFGHIEGAGELLIAGDGEPCVDVGFAIGYVHGPTSCDKKRIVFGDVRDFDGLEFERSRCVSGLVSRRFQSALQVERNLGKRSDEFYIEF